MKKTWAENIMDWILWGDKKEFYNKKSEIQQKKELDDEIELNADGSERDEKQELREVYKI